MNRMYQGKASNVVKRKAGVKGTKTEDWEDFDTDPAQAKDQLIMPSRHVPF